MIRSFADPASHRLFDQGRRRGFRGLDYDRALMLLDALDAAAALTPLRALQAARLHALKGPGRGQWAMTVNARWRITFRFRDGARTMSRSRTTTRADEPKTAMTRIRTHPGHTPRAELAERGMSANQLALAIRVPANRITAILRGDRAITAETAVRLGRHLGTGAQFWMNLQSQFDISVVEATQGEVIERELAGGSSP